MKFVSGHLDQGAKLNTPKERLRMMLSSIPINHLSYELTYNILKNFLQRKGVSKMNSQIFTNLTRCSLGQSTCGLKDIGAEYFTFDS